MRRSVPLLVLVAFVLIPAACAGGSEDGGTGGAAAETPAAAVEEDPVVPGVSSGTLQSAGLDRDYLLVVPESYHGGSPVPLVMVFHGYTMTADDQLHESGIRTLAEEEGLIAVFPEGRGEIQRWLFELDTEEIDISTANPDMALVGDLIDHLTQRLNIDSSRIYAAGFSNGGWMVSAIACTMPDRFAAVAPVAGIMDFGDRCSSTGALPMVTFHGRADSYEPFEGGVDNSPSRDALPTDLGGIYDDLPMSESQVLEASVPDKVASWAARNGCGAEPTSTAINDIVTRWDYDCADPAVLYEIEGGTHSWNLGTAFDTNSYLWEFLSAG